MKFKIYSDLDTSVDVDKDEIGDENDDAADAAEDDDATDAAEEEDIENIERCRGCSGSPAGAWSRPPEMDDRAQSSAGQTITHCTVGHYHTLLVTIRHCWPLSHCW